DPLHTSDVGFNLQALLFDAPSTLGIFDEVSAATRQLARGSVAEYQGEADNEAILDLPVTLVPPPDLQVTALTAPTHAYAGQQFDLSWTVTNTGGPTVPGQEEWDDLVYLARDPHFDIKADTYLGFVHHNGHLNANQGYTISDTLDLPLGMIGPYYVIVVTNPPLKNPQGTLFESNYVDNDRHSAQPLVIDFPPPADLQVTAITTPAAATVGAPGPVT